MVEFYGEGSATANLGSRLVYSRGEPQPPDPFPPYTPVGWPGGLNEGGYLMSLTPKCDMFLEIP